MKDGGHAFPSPIEAIGLNETFNIISAPGMSLRDWLAGQAMAGAIARIPWLQPGIPDDIDEIIARAAYAQSDAMLREREKT